MSDDYIKRPFNKGIKTFNACDIFITRGRGGNIFWQILREGISFFGKKGEQGIVHHAGLYFGSGKHEIIEANPEGVSIAKMEKYINDKEEVLVFRNNNLTALQIALIKTYAYGSVGRPYGYEGVINFVARWFGFKTQDNPRTNFCSENVLLCYNAGGYKMGNLIPCESAPQALLDYLMSEQGKRDGFILFDYQNIGTEFIQKYNIPIA